MFKGHVEDAENVLHLTAKIYVSSVGVVMVSAQHPGVWVVEKMQDRFDN